MRSMARTLAVVATLLLGALPGVAGASPTAAPAGVSINPALKSITLQPGQTEASFTETLENDTRQPVTIAPTASDFTTTGVNGAVSLSTMPDLQHGLASNLHFADSKITLLPQQSKTVQITLKQVGSLSAGGHFAAIRYAVNQGPTAEHAVDLKSELLSFLFVTAAGQANYGVSLKASLPHIVLGSMLHETDLLFTNTGNTQTAPRGTVTISGPLHKPVRQGTINTNSSLVLPGATRLLQTELRPLGSTFWPGHYDVNMYYRPSTMAKYTHAHTQFIFVGWPFILAILAVIGMLIIAIRLLFSWVRKRRGKAALKNPPAKPTPHRKIPVKQL